ncbi:glycosyl hydrolase [Thalassobaculum fulvum]|uniref:beta-N-acetylhexosaminidase n=1 Tax=Thalassobaculum fulvum TaxID=1633335 RepID=A0A918XQS9_9PROT|nr:beta-N-acetylhexosaminidase [Thalassobaculum fulvum]GHD48258.1 glycosyl hydrolase [Thalassobaculum fulvum]
MPTALIFGCAGPELAADEAAFLRDADPYGFILFKRNVETPEQVRSLVAALRDTVGRDAPVLIDQEGGRVQRLGPPHWRRYPPAQAFVRLDAVDPALAEEALRLSAGLMGADLASLGIDVDCVPLADVRQPGSHDVIGDRAFGEDPRTVARLARIQVEAMAGVGVTGVLKHLPGHGRSMVDSHAELPRVEADLAALEAVDFPPFAALAPHVPYGMTGHLLFEAIDPDRPSTLSPTVVHDVIRGTIGFNGLLMTDDLSMSALGGPLGARAAKALAAGCDLALHCNGRMDEMREVAGAVGELTGPALARAVAADEIRRRNTAAAAPPPADAAARLEGLLARGGSA